MYISDEMRIEDFPWTLRRTKIVRLAAMLGLETIGDLRRIDPKRLRQRNYGRGTYNAICEFLPELPRFESLS
jgi:hypothetical protein